MEIRNKLAVILIQFLKKCISVCTGRPKKYNKMSTVAIPVQWDIFLL